MPHNMKILFAFLSSPLAVKRDIAVSILLWCMCVRASVRFVRAITTTFMHGFQNFLHTCCPRLGEVPFETFVWVD